MGSLLTCEEYEPEDVCAAGVLSADGPGVEVGGIAHLARPRVRYVLVAGVFEHGAVLLDGRLQGKYGTDGLVVFSCSPIRLMHHRIMVQFDYWFSGQFHKIRYAAKRQLLLSRSRILSLM